MQNCRRGKNKPLSPYRPIGTARRFTPDLKLEIMKSVSHTRLILNNTGIQHFMVPRIDPSMMLALVKKFGIIERALILEAFLSFLIYAEKILNLLLVPEFLHMTGFHRFWNQTASATKQIDTEKNRNAEYTAEGYITVYRHV